MPSEVQYFYPARQTNSSTLSVTTNGTYNVENYGYINISMVSVPIVQSLHVSSNGVYTAPSGMAFDPVIVSSDLYTIEDLAMRTIVGEVSGYAPYVASYVFGYCSSLTAVSFPSCTSIGGYAFYNCTSLATISFPVCATIGDGAFQYCSSLTEVSFPQCTTIGSYAFASCSALTTVSLPQCTTIGGSAFQYCSSLTTVSFPQCTTIGKSVFYRCYNLISLYLDSVTSVPTLGSSAFNSTPIGGYSISAGQYGSVYVPASLHNAFITATNWSAISSRIVSI